MRIDMKHRGKWSTTPSTLLERAADTLDQTALRKAANAGSVDLLDYAHRVQMDLLRRHSNPWPMGTTPGSLSSRSGGLRAHLNRPASLRHLSDGFEARFTLPGYVGIHEKGGVIKPVRAKYLTVPLPAALDSRGVPLRANARAWPNTFLIRSRAGNLIIMQRRGKDAVPLYVLKKRVRIPPGRLSLTRTLMMHRPALLEDLRHRIRDSLLSKVVGGV